MNRRALNLISTLFVVSYLLVWSLYSSADSGLVKVVSTKPSVAMELFGHPISGTTAITSVMAATEICFPHFADGPSWWTGIAIANPGELPAFISMKAYNDGGQQIGQDFNQIVPPQSQMAPAVIHNLFSLGEIKTGWIKLTSTQPVVALEIFGHTDSSGIAGFSPAAAATEICFPHFAEDADWWTGIAVSNPGTLASQVSITAFSNTGQQIGEIYQELIGGGCRMAPQIVRNMISLGGQTSGWLKITATQPVAAMEIFGQASTSMIASLSAGETGATLYYPYFQEGSGKWTGIAIANPESAEARVTLKAINNDGNTVGEINDLVIPASGRMAPQTITGLFGSLDNEIGCLKVTANHPVIGLGLLGGDGWLAGYTAVAEQTGALVFPHFADSSGWWTKLALMNTSDDSATLSMAAYGVTGTLVGKEKSIDLGPFAAAVENLPFSSSPTNGDTEVIRMVGVLGETLTVTNSLGDIISLEIPIGALQAETEITLRSLNASLIDPIAKNVFPGVEILPDGVTFLVPAKLKVVFAEPLESGAIALLYHVKTAEFIVPLDDLIVTETTIEGYISHLSDYGGGEPSPAEAQALADLALEKIPSSGTYGYDESLEAISDALAICQMIVLLGGGNSCREEIATLALLEVENFLTQPRPEPPCDPDYIKAAFGYWKIITLLGLPSFDDPVQDQEAQAVYKQISDLIDEIIQRCYTQLELKINLNLKINIDVIWDEILKKNYNGEINLGWDTSGYGTGGATYVYGTGILPVTGGGDYGPVTTTFSGAWYIVAEGSVEAISSENGSLMDMILEVDLSGVVLETVVSCTPDKCVSADTNQTTQIILRIPVRGGAHTQVEIEYFDGGKAITTVTLEMINDPMAQ